MARWKRAYGDVTPSPLIDPRVLWYSVTLSVHTPICVELRDALTYFFVICTLHQMLLG
jgi:hypothetical protein